MVTVYFDTSFFINLGAAPERDALQVIDALNQSSVRYVQSSVIFAELARRHQKAETHALALDRLARLQLPPLVLGEHDEWSDLRPGSGRERLSERMRDIDDASIYVRAVASAANKTSRYQEFLSCIVGEGDDRDLRLMAGTISDTSRRRFSSSLRDCSHMAVFASLADSIDFLQVDGPKFEVISSTPTHFLRKMSLADRCFVAKTLSELPAALQSMIARRAAGRA
jgi:hypothetical protein